jgi:predicted SprT family Zn-dependent metalloprotease
MKPKVSSQDAVSKAPKLIRIWSKKWQAPNLRNKVVCEWSSRLTRSLGRAYPSRMLVRLNRALQHRPYASIFNEVLCHEVAHIAVFLLYGAKAASHGPEWKRLVATAGYEPRTGLFLQTKAKRHGIAVWYEHLCPVCHATRRAKRAQPKWRCVACRRAGLEGKLSIRSLPVKRTEADV